jgi:expansin (peptidoglycan-binding protein)
VEERVRPSSRPRRATTALTAALALGVTAGSLVACGGGHREPSVTLAQLMAEAALHPDAGAPTASSTESSVPSAAPGPRPGTTHDGRASAYNLGGSPGSCNYDNTSDATGGMYAALGATDYAGSDACGAYVSVTGPGGSAVVRVVDECGSCAPGSMTLSPAAYAQIAPGASGPVVVRWSLTSPAQIGPVQFEVRDGSSSWWLGIQPRGYRNPVSKLEILVQGVWQDLARQNYNYFVGPSGFGPGPFDVRITDIYGQSVIATGITLSPGLLQTSHVQFPSR